MFKSTRSFFCRCIIWQVTDTAFYLVSKTRRSNCLVRNITELFTSGDFGLYKIKGILIYDWLMRIFYQISSQLAFIDIVLLCNGISAVCFLKKQATCVCDVHKNMTDRPVAPFCTTLSCDTCVIEFSSCFVARLAIKKILIDFPDYISFFLNHNILIAFPLITVNSSTPCRNTISESFPKTPFNIL